MKAICFKTVLLVTLCLSLLSCKKNTSNDLIVFDVNMSVPVKTLDIEDVADIEYLVLDISDDDYLFSGFALMSDNYLVCRSGSEFFFFSRSSGKPVSKISRQGPGPEEYIRTGTFPVYAEMTDDFFNYDGQSHEITVYGRDGTFKRKFPILFSRRTFFPVAIYDYNEEYLLFSGFNLRKEDMRDTTFILMSKHDGSTDAIRIPFEERVTLMYTQGIAASMPYTYFAIRNGKDFLLTDYSSDTVYRFTPDRELIPVFVRQPSIQKMETKIFIHSWIETGNYLFFSTQLIDFDWNTGKWPPEKGYFLEKSSGKFFQTNITMSEYKGKELVLGPSVIHATSSQQNDIIVWNVLELQEANKENKLSGKLKAVTESLSKDDEYVFMILKFK